MVVVVREWGCSGGQSPVVMRLWFAGVYLSPPPPVPQGHVHPCTVGVPRLFRMGVSVVGVLVGAAELGHPCLESRWSECGRLVRGGS